jgi:hypothetical protein
MMRDSPQHIFHVKFQTLHRFHAGVCAACLTASEMSFNAARANLWSELPSFFSLPSWQELRKSLQTHGLHEPAGANKGWESCGKGQGGCTCGNVVCACSVGHPDSSNRNPPPES